MFTVDFIKAWRKKKCQTKIVLIKQKSEEKTVIYNFRNTETELLTVKNQKAISDRRYVPY